MIARRASGRRIVTWVEREFAPDATAALHVLEEVCATRDRLVTHRRVDVKDRVVLRVVTGAHAVNAERDGLREGLALERSGDPAPAHRSRGRGPRGAHEPADRGVFER